MHLAHILQKSAHMPKKEMSNQKWSEYGFYDF